MSLPVTAPSDWLRSYYYVRAAFSVGWVAAAVVSSGNGLAMAILLLLYPAWDALANLVDARRNGGLGKNKSQALNAAASTAVTLAILAAMPDPFAVLSVFGVWAFLAGLLQLVTAARRWRTTGAQWAMILSGAQSMLAGGLMLKRAFGTAVPSILDVAPYAAFGAFYFLVSAVLRAWRYAETVSQTAETRK